MDIEIRTWLFDILKAIDEIDSFFGTDERDFRVFEQDLKLRRAVERNIEIVGEAVSRVLQSSPGIAISNARKIVDARNRIIHGYDSVSDEVVYGIVVKHLPILKEEVQVLLNK
jgi:uncharacterized protein with HEPN domain